MSFGFELNTFSAGFTPQVPEDGCTQCSMCLGACPTYAKTQDPEQSPMGRIRLMRTLKDDGEISPEQMDKLESCLACYSCQGVCPSRVSFGSMLDESLAKIREQRPLPAITRMMLFLASRPAVLKTLVKAAFIAQLTGLRSLMGKLGLYRAMGLQRANALVGRLDYPELLRSRLRRPRNDQRIALFTGCFGSVLEQPVQQAAINTFNALGLEVQVPEGQGCCGALHRHNGELESAGKMAKKNIRAFSAEPVEAIVTTSSGCGAGLKAYSEWLEGEGLAAPVMDVSHYLAELLRSRKVVFEQKALRVAVHTPCTMRQGLAPGEDPQAAVMELLGKIPGLELLPLSGQPRCCGAGGSQMLSQPEMADSLRDEMLEEAKAMRADVLVSSNLGCAMHLRAGLAEAGLDILLKHPVELVADALVVEFVSVGN